MRVVHLSTIHRALDVRIFAKECRSLAQAGYEVHLVIQNPPEAVIEGVTFHGLQVNSENRWRRLGSRLVSVWQQAQQLKGDFYHFHDPELIILGLWLKLKGAKVIYDVHEDTPKEAIALNRDRPLQGYIKAIVWIGLEAVSRWFLDGFVCATPEIAARFPQHKTVLVHNYPLLEELRLCAGQAKAYDDRLAALVYAGGLTKIRGIGELVQAISLIPAELEARLILMGEFSPPNWQGDLEQMPGWLRVDYLGWQSRESVMAWFGQSRLGLVILHPEQIYVESIPNKLFEYMAAGLPVIASDFSRWRQMITELDCGLVVDPLNPKAIAVAMTALLSDPQRAAEMGRNGQKAVIEHFNWDVEAKKLVGLYDALASVDS